MSNSYGQGGHSSPGRFGRDGGEPMSVAPQNLNLQVYPNDGNHPYQNYPPMHDQANPSFKSFGPSLYKNDADVSIRQISRTPSPTPSEIATLNRKGLIDWKAMSNWRYWVRKEWIWYYIIFSIILVLAILISVYDKQIVRWLQPTATKIKNLPAGWVIPIAILFIISFPPLFGHEIIAILCGVVWGLWVGFALVCAGTFVGEVGNFYAFRYCCRARGEKLEKTKIQYACLARIVREGGFKIAVVARYSAIPGHFTTAIFSTCGMSIWVFAIAAILTLPKQFITVYIGVMLEESGDGTETTKDKIIQDTVLAVTILVTMLAMWYLSKKVDAVKHDVIYDRRKARQAKLGRAGNYPYANGSAAESGSFDPRESESDLPLNPGDSYAYQGSDSEGHEIGVAVSAPQGSIVAPAPQRFTPAPEIVVNRMSTSRNEQVGGYSTSGERYNLPPGAMLPGVRQNQQPDAWDKSNQGMDADAVRLTPVQSGGSTSTSANANVRYQPPSGPPPSQQAILHPRVQDPFASSENFGSGAPAPVPVTPLAPPPASTHTPSAQPTATQNTTTLPANMYYGSSSDFAGPRSHPQSPTQFAMAYEPPIGASTSVHSVPGSGTLPSPHFASDNVEAYGGLAHSSDGYYGAHVQAPSDASAYYTAPHSRVGTEDELLPPRALHTPPPPSYRTQQSGDLR